MPGKWMRKVTKANDKDFSGHDWMGRVLGQANPAADQSTDPDGINFRSEPQRTGQAAGPSCLSSVHDPCNGNDDSDVTEDEVTRCSHPEAPFYHSLGSRSL